MRPNARHLRLVCLLPIAYLLCASVIAATPRIDQEARELIVKFKEGIISPTDVLAAIDEARRAPHPSRFALYRRLGNPVSGRWLIDFRLPPQYIANLKAVDPDHPEIHLQQYVVLTYANPGDRLAAEVRLQRDVAVFSVRPNSRQQFSSRVNDYFANTNPAVDIPEGYQWALETLRIMSPYANPGAQSAWDVAKGHGFIGVVDSGVDPGHPDLQPSVRFHFSQAFFSNGCTGSLTEVDEAGASSTCPNSYRGHGTHVSGLIAATPDNAIGIAGVCWACSLIVAKAYANNRSFTSDIVNGINHSIIRGAQLVNLSSGSQDYLQQYGVGVDYCSKLGAGADVFCDALAFAERRELVIVAAAGNNNNVKRSPTDSFFATHFPATEPTIVSIGGTTYGDAIWADDPLEGTSAPQGSNLDKIDLVAPAKQVVSTFYRGSTWFYPTWCSDTINDGIYTGGYGYDECTGTSMATPLATGVLTLTRSLSPLLPRSELVGMVQNTARTVAGIYKMPDALAAAQAAVATNDSVSPMFSFVAGTYASTTDNRFFTAAPQMAVAAINGTMLPNLAGSTVLVPYSTDFGAPVVSGYVFPRHERK